MGRGKGTGEKGASVRKDGKKKGRLGGGEGNQLREKEMVE